MAQEDKEHNFLKGNQERGKYKHKYDKKPADVSYLKQVHEGTAGNKAKGTGLHY
jgi:hypothetical protein